jgi:hypothetical protein
MKRRFAFVVQRIIPRTCKPNSRESAALFKLVASGERDAIGNREAKWMTIGAIVFAVCFGYPILAHLSRGDISSYPQSDWDYFLHLRWVPFYTIRHFHQFPLWNPYNCGGMPLIGNPQSAILTPFLLLDLMFGPVIGARLRIIVDIAIGFSGAYVLARELGISKLGAVACAIAFAGSSWHYLHAEVGHLNFMCGGYAPWALALLQVSFVRKRLAPAALGGLVMALIVLEGGVSYVFLETAFLLALFGPMAALQQRTTFPLLAIAAMGAFTVGFTAIEVLPVLAYTGVHGAASGPDEVTNGWLLVRALLSRNQSPFDGFYEIGAYIGVFFGGLALCGSIFRWRRALPWLILFVPVLLIAAGNHGPYWPWVLTHELPFYGSQRGPFRWMIMLPLVAGVLAGFGIDTIRATSNKWGTIAASMFITVAFVDEWLVATPYLHLVVEATEDSLPWSSDFRQIVDNQYGRRMFASGRANMGVASCYETRGIMPNTKARGYNQPDYLGEQYLLGPGIVKRRRWTPNELSFDVNSLKPSTMVVNQNYDPGWSVAEGKGEIVAVSRDDLLELTVPAGEQRLVLVYRSRQLLIGLFITLGSLAALMLLWKYERSCEPR